MECSSCGHENVTDFPFCEECLALLAPRPERLAAGGFELEAPARPQGSAGGRWPPFPWNPRDLPDPLIGRDKPLEQLAAAWRETVQGWRARIHLLVGEYGLGKSRVSSRLVERGREVEPDALVVRVRCPPVGGPFRLWDALIREAIGIPHDADAVDAGQRLLGELRAYFDDEAEDVAGAIAWLVGYELPGKPEDAPVADEALVGRGTAAIARLLDALSIRHPLLLIVDHADRASVRSLGLAGAVETSLRERPLMLVLTGSRELPRILPGWERFPVARLEPLSRGDARRMLRLFLEGLDEVPRELEQRVLDRAGGNPYALKSMVRYLRDAGAIRAERGTWRIDPGVALDLEVPQDLEGVILAQVGNLSDDERTVLAHAAVVGRHFWLGALVALARLDAEEPERPGEIRRDEAPERIRQALERLLQLRFVQRHDSTLPGEEGFAFRSDVHWRVAEELLPATTRARFHRVVLQWLRVHAGEHAEGLLSDLARQAEAAGYPGEAAVHQLRAARRARREHDLREARSQLESARTLAEPDDVGTRLEVGLELGEVLATVGDVDGSLARYQEALWLAWRVRHRARGALALGGIGSVERERGDLASAHEHLVQSLRLYEAVGEHAGVARACVDLGRLAWLRSDFEEALRYFRKAEELFGHQGDRRGLAEAVHNVGAVHHDRGDLADAEHALGEALRLRRELDDREGVAQTLNTLGVLRMQGGEASSAEDEGSGDAMERAVACWREALDLGVGTENLAIQAKVADNLGEALTALGRLDEAGEHLDRAAALAHQADQRRILVDVRCNLARLHAVRGAWAEADEALDVARRAADALDLRRTTAVVERTRGDLEARRAHEGTKGGERRALERAARAYERAGQRFEQGGYDLEGALTREHLGGVYEALERSDEADRARREARELRARHRTRTSPEAGRADAEPAASGGDDDPA